MRQWAWAMLVSLVAGLLPLAASAAERFTVEGDRLIFDTFVEINGEVRDIRRIDVNMMRDRLRENPGIRVLEINSGGGGHYPAIDLAALVIDFELDTHIEDTCESSCVTVFLGGQKRTMARGARLGFHQLSWDAEALARYYEDHRDHRDWDTPFEFTEWVYEDTQSETYNRLTYMLSRGVNAEFAIRTIRTPDTTMWYPLRPVLMAAGVLTE